MNIITEMIKNKLVTVGVGVAAIVIGKVAVMLFSNGQPPVNPAPPVVPTTAVHQKPIVRQPQTLPPRDRGNGQERFRDRSKLGRRKKR